MDAIAQARGRSNFFRFEPASNAAEHALTEASTDERALAIGDVVELPSLLAFRPQRHDMPRELRDMIGRIAGDVLITDARIREFHQARYVRTN